jgi:hypothetical protein
MSERSAQRPVRGRSAAATTMGARGRWRFALVLLAALLVSAGQPILSELYGDRNTFDVGVTILIMAVMLLVTERSEHRRVVLPLGLAGFLGLWGAHGVEGTASSALLVGSHVLAICLFAFALGGIVRAILVGHASGDAILGALCGYLLLGIIWGLVYSAVETAAPGSFHVQSRARAGDAGAPADRGALGYFSFVTLSTVGYGDVTPTTPVARTLAWLEAVTGQFYLAVLVAGLVGFKVSQGLKGPSENSALDEAEG